MSHACCIDGLVESDELKEKKARLAEDLNEKILHRPGPLELVKKNILPLPTNMKDGIKGEVVLIALTPVISAQDFLMQENNTKPFGISSSVVSLLCALLHLTIGLPIRSIRWATQWSTKRSAPCRLTKLPLIEKLFAYHCEPASQEVQTPKNNLLKKVVYSEE